MADLITSGLAPGIVMYNLFMETGVKEFNYSIHILKNEFIFSFAPLALVGFLIPLSASIRLAKFNIDNDQRFDFKGLPSPANALFIMALPLLIEHPFFSSLKSLLFSYWTLFILTLISSLLMNLKLPLFSFKIKTLDIKDYRYQIFIIVFSLPAFYFLDWAAVPLIILIYLILNFLKNSIT